MRFTRSTWTLIKHLALLSTHYIALTFDSPVQKCLWSMPVGDSVSELSMNLFFKIGKWFKTLWGFFPWGYKRNNTDYQTYNVSIGRNPSHQNHSSHLHRQPSTLTHVLPKCLQWWETHFFEISFNFCKAVIEMSAFAHPAQHPLAESILQLAKLRSRLVTTLVKGSRVCHSGITVILGWLFLRSSRQRKSSENWV